MCLLRTTRALDTEAARGSAHAPLVSRVRVEVPERAVHGPGELAVGAAKAEGLDVLALEVGIYGGTVFGVAADDTIAVEGDVRSKDLERKFGCGASKPALAFEAVVGEDAKEEHHAVAVGHAAVGDLVGAWPAVDFADEVFNYHVGLQGRTTDCVEDVLNTSRES